MQMDHTTPYPSGFTTRQIASMSGLTEATIMGHVKSGRLASVKIYGRRIIPVDTAHEWLAKHSKVQAA